MQFAVTLPLPPLPLHGKYSWGCSNITYILIHQINDVILCTRFNVLFCSHYFSGSHNTNLHGWYELSCLSIEFSVVTDLLVNPTKYQSLVLSLWFKIINQCLCFSCRCLLTKQPVIGISTCKQTFYGTLMVFSMNQGQPKVQPVWHSGHHIWLSAVSCDFLHQEILAFRCIGRLLGGPFGQKAPACRCTCRWRRRFRLVFPPSLWGSYWGKL